MMTMKDPSCRFCGTFFFLCWFLIQNWTASLATCRKKSVAVWDNVLSVDNRNQLHKATSQLGSSRHFLFQRPIDPQKSGMIEKTLDSILTEMDDDSKYVEFWTRQEWRSIEAHADVDEMLAKSEDAEGNSRDKPFRFPINGHVLYLQVGDEVRGPTCVFPGRQSGGDLLTAAKGYGNNDNEGVELVSVPAVPGRLLRFQGDYLHAVPRPHDLWFRKFIQGAPSYSPEETWGRSVVLFNTWGDDPPVDVQSRSAIAGDEIVSSHPLCESQSAWIDAYDETEANSGGTCINTDSEIEYVKAKIWLLGNERRRSYQMRTVPLLAPGELAATLGEESAVRRTNMQQS
ncbi:unnamed protein product [Cylindrotheca closterium]|uniref:Uncharacterized protein n=1 Tax=Cylindrotheca closterium TaxID=2856 RepID=A0AAD2JLC3_9STRA|nr:unnamed protein product [Cylindrotheca closterium]